jgi:hypothetical protein
VHPGRDRPSILHLTADRLQPNGDSLTNGFDQAVNSVSADVL